MVVPTGGGIVVAGANRALMRESGWIVCLEARPETILARVSAHQRADGERGARPLLDAPDPLARIRELKAARQAAYAEAHWTVHTDHLTAEQVADEVARGVALLEGSADDAPGAAGGFRFGERWFGRDRPLLCVPIVARTAAEAREAARRAAALAPDALELRADWLADPTPAAAVGTLAEVAALGLPVVFTNRLEAEGGARARDEAGRAAVLAAAIASGLPALVDVELATAAPERDRLLAAARRRGVPVMLSFHDFAATPDDATLRARLRAIAATGADAAKIATMARDEDDALRLLALCRAETAPPRPPTSGGTDGGAWAVGRGPWAVEQARPTRPVPPSDPDPSRSGGAGGGMPIAAMAMGPFGAITRILGHRAGSALTFAAAAAGAGSAPGQLTVAQLRACWAATDTAPVGRRGAAGRPPAAREGGWG